MVRHKSFDHLGGFYHYRVHDVKTKELCANGYSSLKNYLNAMFSNCPNEFFDKGPRSSALKFKISNLDIKKTKNHEVCKLAENGLNENFERYKTNHSRVQVFMLENDDKTVAMEVPLWLFPNEFKYFNELFKSNWPLTGHIDVLRVEDDKIWVWDYKPNAYLEKFATTQVYFYALMLSRRIGVDLRDFRCGYFDENHAFMFKPVENIKIEKELTDLFGFVKNKFI